MTRGTRFIVSLLFKECLSLLKSRVVRSDIRKAFDAGSWALVPEEELLDCIYEKIDNEQTRRRKEFITGPWPDFSSPKVRVLAGGPSHATQCKALPHSGFLVKPTTSISLFL